MIVIWDGYVWFLKINVVFVVGLSFCEIFVEVNVCYVLIVFGIEFILIFN